METSSDFVQFQNDVDAYLKEGLQEKSIEKLKIKVKESLESISQQNGGLEVGDIRSVVDLAFRRTLVDICSADTPSSSHQDIEVLVDLSIASSKEGLCSIHLPITLLIDTWDLKSLDECEQLFHLVEDRVDVWKSDHFYKSVKNQLLRTCNDLLRRLSRSQNTVFCGRILVFLARFFPLFERSGLNIIGEFNKDNVIVISLESEGEKPSQPEASQPSTATSELEEGEEGEAPEKGSESQLTPPTIDDALYVKFWQLQEFFRQPQLCYERLQWKKFQTYASDVLSALNALKLDQSNVQDAKGEESVYFAKFLTSQKLLELQLSDSNFRRYILIQFLILFQYLVATVKFKTDSQVLTDEQKDFIGEYTSKIYDLISQTPPNGSDMCRTIKQILRREETWSKWKNDGCIEVKPQDIPKPRIVGQKLNRVRAGDDLKIAQAAGKYNLGNKELTRLWNLCPDNWEACRSKKRVFTPTVDEFFEDVVKQDKDKRLKTVSGDSNFTWRSLRLLSQKSSHFFPHSNVQVRPVYTYMESVLDNLSKVLDQPKTPTDSAIDDAEDVSDEEFLKMPEESSRGREASSSPQENGDETPITKNMIKNIVKKIAPKWKTLAAKFTFGSDEIEYFESESPNDPVAAAERMLLIWLEQFPEDANVNKFRELCKKSGIEVSFE